MEFHLTWNIDYYLKLTKDDDVTILLTEKANLQILDIMFNID